MNSIIENYERYIGKYVSMVNITIPMNLSDYGITTTSSTRNFLKNRAVEYRKVLGVEKDTELIKLGPGLVLDRSNGNIAFWSMVPEVMVPSSAIAGVAILYDSVLEDLNNFFNDRDYFVAGKVL